MFDLKNYLQIDQLLKDDDRALKVKLYAPRLQIMEERLYRRSFNGPLLQCLIKYKT